MNSAARLRQWRKAKNITVEQLDDDIGKKPVTIRAYESARNTEPQLADLRVWAEKYGLDVHWYTTGVGDMDYSFRGESEKTHKRLEDDIRDLKQRLDFWVRAYEESAQKSEKEMQELVKKYDKAMRILRGDENKPPAQVYKPKPKKGDKK